MQKIHARSRDPGSVSMRGSGSIPERAHATSTSAPTSPPSPPKRDSDDRTRPPLKVPISGWWFIRRWGSGGGERIRGGEASQGGLSHLYGGHVQLRDVRSVTIKLEVLSWWERQLELGSWRRLFIHDTWLERGRSNQNPLSHTKRLLYLALSLSPPPQFF